MSDIVKAVARIIHFTSMGLLFSYVTGYLISDTKEGIPVYVRRFADIGGIGAIISGLVNWYFLKSFKPMAEPTDFKIWTSIVHSKTLVLLFFFTPILKIFGGSEKTNNTVRIVVIMIFVCVSPFVRRLREKYSPKYQINTSNSNNNQGGEDQHLAQN